MSDPTLSVWRRRGREPARDGPGRKPGWWGEPRGWKSRSRGGPPPTSLPLMVRELRDPVLGSRKPWPLSGSDPEVTPRRPHPSRWRWPEPWRRSQSARRSWAKPAPWPAPGGRSSVADSSRPTRSAAPGSANTPSCIAGRVFRYRDSVMFQPLELMATPTQAPPARDGNRKIDRGSVDLSRGSAQMEVRPPPSFPQVALN